MMAAFRQAMRIPFGLPAPSPLLELGSWFMRTETELVIKSRRVIPGRLLAEGFRFQYPRMKEALEDLVQRGKPETSFTESNPP